jgi:cation diffusion facilitator CzcD-associated flavoprotein CzcO
LEVAVSRSHAEGADAAAPSQRAARLIPPARAFPCRKSDRRSRRRGRPCCRDDAEGRYPTDFIIFGTGFKVDLALRPELADLAPHIRLWRDRFAAPLEMANPELEHSPDLGDSFEFLEKVPGACPALSRLHCFNYPATLSHGKLSGDIPAISEGGDRLARGIVRRIFVDDREIHFANLQAFATPELLGDEWTDADAAAARHASG